MGNNSINTPFGSLPDPTAFAKDALKTAEKVGGKAAEVAGVKVDIKGKMDALKQKTFDELLPKNADDFAKVLSNKNGKALAPLLEETVRMSPNTGKEVMLALVKLAKNDPVFNEELRVAYQAERALSGDKRAIDFFMKRDAAERKPGMMERTGVAIFKAWDPKAVEKEVQTQIQAKYFEALDKVVARYPMLTRNTLRMLIRGSNV